MPNAIHAIANGIRTTVTFIGTSRFIRTSKLQDSSLRRPVNPAGNRLLQDQRTCGCVIADLLDRVVHRHVFLFRRFILKVILYV